MKPLEALEEIDRYIVSGEYTFFKPHTKIIEKHLKALEIIVKKRVNIDALLHALYVFKESYALSQYNAMYGNKIVINGVEQPNKALTQEEFDLIKEVIKEYE